VVIPPFLTEVNVIFAEKEGEKTIDGYFGIGDIDYTYNEDKLLDYEIKKPKGEGYAIDLHVNWQY